MNTLPVSEVNYEETMKTVVEPFLAGIREDVFYHGWDDNKLHCEVYVLDDPKGNVVISHGFTESAEKFREMTYAFLQMGYSVFVPDHRGHGKSFRYNPGDPETVTIRSFDEYVNDLAKLVSDVVTPRSKDKPLF